MLEKQEILFLIKILENAQIKGVNALGVVNIFEKLQSMHDAYDNFEKEQASASVKKTKPIKK